MPLNLTNLKHDQTLSFTLDLRAFVDIAADEYLLVPLFIFLAGYILGWNGKTS